MCAKCFGLNLSHTQQSCASKHRSTHHHHHPKLYRGLQFATEFKEENLTKQYHAAPSKIQQTAQ